METGQWVDGDLYNGRIVLIANSYVLKNLYLIIQGNLFLWDEIKIPVQYGSNYELAKSIILEAGIAVGELVYNLKRNGKLCKVNTG
jgi:small-conductance mechanosensitive channel